MGPVSLQVRYRPMRIGWCVDGESLTDFELAVRFSHTCWGGRYNPIIPCANPEMASALISGFKVDALYDISKTETISDFIKQHSHIPWPDFRQELYKSHGDSSYASVLDVVHPVRHIHDDHVKDRETPTLPSHLYEWKESDPLHYVFLATLGAYPSKEAIGRDYADLFKRGLKPSIVPLSERDEVPRDVFRHLTPATLTSSELEEIELGISAWRAPGFYLGDASDFTDLVNYWNLRASNIDLFFYDRAHGERLDSLRSAYSELLQKRPTREPWPTYVKVWQKTRGGDAAPFQGELTLATMTPGLFNGLNLNPPSMGFARQSVLGTSSEHGEATSVTFQFPSKPFFVDDFRYHDQKVVVSVQASEVLESDSLFTPPFIPQLNEYYGRSAYFDYDKVRAEPNSLGIICSVTKEQLTLRALPFSEIISKTFNAFGIKATPSSAGLVGRRLIEQMGGLQGCRVFKIEGVRNLIREHSPTKAFDRSAAIRTIGKNDPVTGRPNFEDFKRLHIELRDHRDLKPEDALTYLLAKGVFQVGLTLKCSVCELDFWLGLDDVKSQVRCLYCGKEFNILMQLRDRAWAYRRSGLFGRDDHQKGGIPVALTLQQLETALHGSLKCFTTAMDLEPQGAAVPKCETDFVALITAGIRDDRPLQLLIGECKDRGGEITASDAANLKAVAEAFNKSPFSVYILFAKAGEFSTDEIDHCKSARTTIGTHVVNNVILLSQRELEPYFMYSQSEKLFDIQSSAVSLMDMALNTHNIFFEPRAKIVSESSSPKSE